MIGLWFLIEETGISDEQLLKSNKIIVNQLVNNWLFIIIFKDVLSISFKDSITSSVD